jgi:hypothetical protein
MQFTRSTCVIVDVIDYVNVCRNVLPSDVCVLFGRVAADCNSPDKN